jgi:N-acyl-D-aspartate/D-glutamate deacylase
LIEKLSDTNFRNQVRAELATTATFRLFNNEWDKVHVVETYLPEHAHFEQRTVADIAKEQQKDPLDFALDLAVSEDLDGFTALLLNSDIDAVGPMLNHPHSLVSLSDAGAHLTFFNDAGFGLHLMGYWSRELGKMTLQEAVRRLTSLPAQVMGLKNRGKYAKVILQISYCLTLKPSTVAINTAYLIYPAEQLGFTQTP